MNAVIIGQGSGGGSGSGGSNASVGLNGSPAPLSSTEIGFINASGNEVGVSATNPLPITGTITASNPSVGATGSPAPAFATEIGVINASGNLVGSSASNPVRIDPTGTTVQPVSGTITALQGTSPWVVSGTITANAVGTLTNNNAAPGANNMGVLPAVANASPQTWTEGDQVLLSVDLSGRQRMRGTLTPNNAAPGSDGQMALTTIANAAAPTYTEGDLVLASVDLNGATRIVGTRTSNSAAPTFEVNVQPALAKAVSPLWTEGNQVLESVDLHGGQRQIGGNIPEISVAWTSATALNTSLTLTPILGYGTVVVTLQSTTTITGGIVTFEVSDTAAGTNWYTIPGFPLVNLTNPSVPSGSFVLTPSSFTTFPFNVAGYAAFRVRLSTVIAGTGTVNVGIQASAETSVPLTAVANVVTNKPTGFAVTVADNILTAVDYQSLLAAGLLIANTVYGGAFSGSADVTRQGWSKTRTPTVFKTATANGSGNTAIWTPGSGNKFRLMKFQITVPGNAAFATTAGTVTITFQDATTDLNIKYVIYVPLITTLTPGVSFNSGWVDLGQFGELSAAVNNVLNINLVLGGTGAFSGGAVVMVSGTEE